MQVRVLLFGVLKEIAGGSEHLVQAAPGTTISQLFETFETRFGALKSRRGSILFARNQEFTSPDTAVADGDEVAFLPPVSGGSSPVPEPEFIPCTITREPIDTAALSRLVSRNNDGAVVTFEGIVRNNTGGRLTLYLNYEAYEPLAIAQMNRIADQIRNQFAVGRVTAVHRLGRLQVGEASIAIAVGAPHRRPAFEAALEFIDRLKREVPIWKKEYFADGEIWVEGEWSSNLAPAPTQQ